MIWRACDRSWEFPRPTLVMGVVNVTPDSFSDGGKFQSTDQAVEHALRLAEEGADILDIGGESTRSGAECVDAHVELRRVIPVIEKLAGQTKSALSIDTQKPSVAQSAVEAGAVIINDIAANRADEAMWQLVAETGAGYVAMHMLGTPQTMQKAPQYCNVVNDVEAFFYCRMERWTDWGMALDQVVLDPGIGFGKTLEHNLALLAALERFTRMQRPLLVGASRKSFIGHVTKTEVNDRLPGSLACACRAAQAGAGIVRAHDVKETVQALQTWEAISKA
jgi:dihydropteroate synthase|tara:strand:- start:440 stop:1273 length:834 start_codon:yes stop_codon:yes gene_type:complete